MSWLQITFVVNTSHVAALSDLLELFMAQAVTSENAGEDEFYEVAFPGQPDWQKVSVTGLFNDAIDPDPIIDFVHQQFAPSDADEIPTTVTRLKDQDWERVWLERFKPVRVGHQLWICPSWCEPEQPNERNIVLDPGLAFGTGTHPTTGLCLQWLAEQDLAHQQVLDYGAGTGVLAIAALLSGAEHAVAVDIDPLAVSAASDNAQRNGVAAQLESLLPEQLDKRRFELVIANILADVIIELRTELLLHLQTGGTLILTGILNQQSERVCQAFGPEFDFDKHVREQWCLLVGRSARPG